MPSPDKTIPQLLHAIKNTQAVDRAGTDKRAPCSGGGEIKGEMFFKVSWTRSSLACSLSGFCSAVTSNDVRSAQRYAFSCCITRQQHVSHSRQTLDEQYQAENRCFGNFVTSAQRRIKIFSLSTTPPISQSTETVSFLLDEQCTRQSIGLCIIQEALLGVFGLSYQVRRLPRGLTTTCF